MKSIANHPPSPDKIKTLSFKDFYDLTGVDLVLTGTNITQHSPRYFSVYHTPDFPVIEAVQISMTLPGAFRPVYVNTDVRKGDEEQRKRYAGLDVDGGMLNNYPIHAFDNIEMTDGTDDPDAQHLCDLTYYGINWVFPIAGNQRLRNTECNCVLGMRLQDFENADFKTEEDELYPAEGGVLIDFLKDLYNTLGYGAEEGQIRSLEDERKSVEFYATVDKENRLFKALNKRNHNIDDDDKFYTLKLADFSTPAIDRLRNRKDLAQVKESLMIKAGEKLKIFIER